MKVNSWEQFCDALLIRKVSFLVAFFFIFMLSFAILSGLGFTPDLVVEEQNSEENEPEVVAPPAATSTVEIPVVEERVVVEPVFPETIIIDSLDRSVTVLNPTSRDITDLDAALLYGVVRHPDSATLEQTGTVFMLGHSSYLPTVLNKNFQAFNGIQKLNFGDTIRVQSKGLEYVYRVDRVYRASAQDVTVPIAVETNKLVLATCNSFGSIDDRYIVEADLFETKTL